MEEVIGQIESAKAAGASGIFLYSLYHYTSVDTKGIALSGYGKLPRREYLEAIKEINK